MRATVSLCTIQLISLTARAENECFAETLDCLAVEAVPVTMKSGSTERAALLATSYQRGRCLPRKSFPHCTDLQRELDTCLVGLRRPVQSVVLNFIERACVAELSGLHTKRCYTRLLASGAFEQTTEWRKAFRLMLCCA